MKRAKSVKDAKHGTCGGHSEVFHEVFASDDVLPLYLQSIGMHNFYEVDSAKVTQLAILYLQRKYTEAFACLEKNFSFLFENEKKQSICTEWYHDTIRRIIKIVADRPHELKYVFAKSYDYKKF